jgi:hypothetical protein
MNSVLATLGLLSLCLLPGPNQVPDDPRVPKVGDQAPPQPQMNYEAAVIAAIHHFTQTGEVKYLSAFLDKHPSLINATQRFQEGRKPGEYDYYTPLHWAAEKGKVEVVELLLKHKADTNADCGNGLTPLHLAARYGNLEVCRVLLKNGANAAARTKPLPERTAPGGPPGQPPFKLPAEPALTPLDVARENKKQDVVDLLLAHMKDAKDEPKK